MCIGHSSRANSLIVLNVKNLQQVLNHLKFKFSPDDISCEVGPNFFEKVDAVFHLAASSNNVSTSEKPDTYF